MDLIGQLPFQRSYESYFGRREREAYWEQLGFVSKSIRFLESYPRFLSAENRASIAPYHSRADELVVFLDQYVTKYTEEELRRRADFFAGKSLDRQQLEAVVKNDTYNLVIAAAGSGKTRALTAKFAYLVESGVAPNRILALAYTNPAREEMRKRLEGDYGIRNANVKTFHSLGRGLARTDVATGPEQKMFITEIEKRLRSEREFAKLLLAFALELRIPEPEKPANPEEYYELLRNQKYVTLDLKTVDSIAERDIGNFFFLNRIKYAHGLPAKWADGTTMYRQYRPDFFLPEYNIWVEHWAIDRRARAPHRCCENRVRQRRPDAPPVTLPVSQDVYQVVDRVRENQSERVGESTKAAFYGGEEGIAQACAEDDVGQKFHLG